MTSKPSQAPGSEFHLYIHNYSLQDALEAHGFKYHSHAEVSQIYTSVFSYLAYSLTSFKSLLKCHLPL